MQKNHTIKRPVHHSKCCSMNRLSFLIYLTCLVVGSSCNKHKILDQERERLDAERQRLLTEINSLDAKIQAMPDAYNTIAIQRQIEGVEQKAAQVENEAATKMKKWSDIEAQFLPLKAQAEQYKAKYGN